MAQNGVSGQDVPLMFSQQYQKLALEVRQVMFAVRPRASPGMQVELAVSQEKQRERGLALPQVVPNGAEQGSGVDPDRELIGAEVSRGAELQHRARGAPGARRRAVCEDQIDVLKGHRRRRFGSARVHGKSGDGQHRLCFLASAVLRIDKQ